MIQHDFAEKRARRLDLRSCVSLVAIVVASGPARAEDATPVPDVSVTAAARPSRRKPIPPL